MKPQQQDPPPPARPCSYCGKELRRGSLATIHRSCQNNLRVSMSIGQQMRDERKIK